MAEPRDPATVSVIIPTHNHARYVRQAVDSVLGQTYPQVEIIVVDDGSEDDTRAVLAEYQDKIHYHYQEKQGVSRARNTGLQLSRGETILFLDADDLIPPQKLAVQVAYLDTHPQIGLVCSAWQYIDESNTHVLQEVHPQVPAQPLVSLLRRSFAFPISAAVVRWTCFEQAGVFDESLHASEDTDLWIRIALAGFSFGSVDEVLFSYRIVPGSVTHRLEHQAHNELLRLEKFFARPDLPVEVRGLEAEAEAMLHSEFCARYLTAGQAERAQEQLRQAIQCWPEILHQTGWFLGWVSSSAMDLAVPDPEAWIEAFFPMLPEEASAWRGLRRRVRGSYHIVAAYRAYSNRQYRAVLGHFFPACVQNPAILGNRGFLSLALRSLGATIRGDGGR